MPTTNKVYKATPDALSKVFYTTAAKRPTQAASKSSELQAAIDKVGALIVRIVNQAEKQGDKEKVLKYTLLYLKFLKAIYGNKSPAQSMATIANRLFGPTFTISFFDENNQKGETLYSK